MQCGYVAKGDCILCISSVWEWLKSAGEEGGRVGVGLASAIAPPGKKKKTMGARQGVNYKARFLKLRLATTVSRDLNLEKPQLRASTMGENEEIPMHLKGAEKAGDKTW